MADNFRTASQTALTAAAARAAHLIVDSEPVIFADELAGILLGERADELIAYHREHGAHPVLSGARAQVTVRSRYTEDRLAASAARGVSQYVILGAGLDSFAYRSPLARQIRVFEVDHAASQAAKREVLSRAGIEPLGDVTYIGADFEAGSLASQLVRGGLDPSRPALVSWLGVTLYLTRDAIGQTLAGLGSLAPGSELIADYLLPAGLRDAAGDTYAELVHPVTAEWGEPCLTLLSPADMAQLLTAHGFAVAEQAGQREAIGAALWERRDSLRPIRLSVLVRASVMAPAREASRQAGPRRQAGPGGAAAALRELPSAG